MQSITKATPSSNVRRARQGKAALIMALIIPLVSAVAAGGSYWLSTETSEIRNLVARGDRWLEYGDPDRAVTNYREALEACSQIQSVDRWELLFPARREMAQIRCQLGVAHAMLGNEQEACEHFQQAFALDEHVAPRSDDATVDRVFCQAKTDMLVERLSSADTSSRRNAARRLKELGWEPLSPEQRARWLCASGDYERVAEMGDAGITMLIGELRRVTDAELRSTVCSVLLNTDDEQASRAVDRYLQEKLQKIGAIVKQTVPTETAVSTSIVNLSANRRRLVVSGHLLEGVQPTDDSPYVRGDYRSSERLQSKAELRCFEIYRAIFQDVPMSEFESVAVECKHGVRVQVVPFGSSWGPTGPGNDQAMTILTTSLTPEDAQGVVWTNASVDDVKAAWTVEDNVIPSLQFMAVSIPK